MAFETFTIAYRVFIEMLQVGELITKVKRNLYLDIENVEVMVPVYFLRVDGHRRVEAMKLYHGMLIHLSGKKHSSANCL